MGINRIMSGYTNKQRQVNYLNGTAVSLNIDNIACFYFLFLYAFVYGRIQFQLLGALGGLQANNYMAHCFTISCNEKEIMCMLTCISLIDEGRSICISIKLWPTNNGLNLTIHGYTVEGTDWYYFSLANIVIYPRSLRCLTSHGIFCFHRRQFCHFPFIDFFCFLNS